MNIKFKIQRDALPEEEWNYENVVWSGINNDNFEENTWVVLRSIIEDKTIQVPMSWIRKIEINP